MERSLNEGSLNIDSTVELQQLQISVRRVGGGLFYMPGCHHRELIKGVVCFPVGRLFTLKSCHHKLHIPTPCDAPIRFTSPVKGICDSNNYHKTKLDNILVHSTTNMSDRRDSVLVWPPGRTLFVDIQRSLYCFGRYTLYGSDTRFQYTLLF